MGAGGARSGPGTSGTERSIDRPRPGPGPSAAADDESAAASGGLGVSSERRSERDAEMGGEGAAAPGGLGVSSERRPERRCRVRFRAEGDVSAFIVVDAKGSANRRGPWLACGETRATRAQLHGVGVGEFARLEEAAEVLQRAGRWYVARSRRGATTEPGAVAEEPEGETAPSSSTPRGPSKRERRERARGERRGSRRAALAAEAVVLNTAVVARRWAVLAAGMRAVEVETEVAGTPAKEVEEPTEPPRAVEGMPFAVFMEAAMAAFGSDSAVAETPTEQAAATSNAEIVERMSAAEAHGDAERGVCHACKVSHPLQRGFSNKQRARVARGMGRCRICVASECGWPKAPVAQFQTTSEPISEEERDAAFEDYRVKLSALRAARLEAEREAKSAAAEAARLEPVFFQSRRVEEGGEEYACFGSWYPYSPFVDSVGRTFDNTGQFIFHRKAMTMGDGATAALILAETDPGKVEVLGGAVSNYELQRWKRYAPVWTEDALWRQFSGDAALGAVLLGTGERPLIEASSGGSAVWGTGMGAAECRAASPGELAAACEHGNLWGKCLSRVRARLRFRERLRGHDGAVPLCCAEGGVDFEAFADVLEAYLRTVPLEERAVVCSSTGHRFQDDALVDLLRSIKEAGGVPATAESLAELAKGDRQHGSNGRLTLEELRCALGLLADEEARGWVLKYLSREALREAGYANVWVNGVFMAEKKADGSPKKKVSVDLVQGVVRDGVHHPLMPSLRWIDHLSKESSPGAEDSVNDFSPMSLNKLHSKLDGVPYAAEVAMALMSDDGRLGQDELRAVEGSTVDVSHAYRLLPLAQRARALHVFRFLDPDQPIPQYVLDGEQPREEDMVWFVKTVMPFGWRLSVDFWVRFSKALKALHLWDDCPALSHRVPRGADGGRQHDASIYIDDAGLYALKGLGQLSQDRYLELLSFLRIPASKEKLEAEGGVTQELHMLGVVFDFLERELKLSPKRLEALLRRCRAMRDKSYCSREEFDSLVGVLSFCAGCVSGGAGRTFMRSLYNLQRGRRGKWVRLPRSAKVDLSWWIRFAEQYNGASMMLDDYFTTAEELGVFADASLEGYGACWVKADGTAEYFGGRWDQLFPGIDTSQETGEWHVSELEALVQLMVCHQWGASFSGRRIVIRCDNDSAVTAINQMRCADPGMHTAVAELWYTKLVHSFDVRCRHVKTAANVLGDCPSRWTLADGTRDSKYVDEFFEFAGSVFGLRPEAMVEVEPSFDTLGMLRRMKKAHRGKVHRLNV